MTNKAGRGILLFEKRIEMDKRNKKVITIAAIIIAVITAAVIGIIVIQATPANKLKRQIKLGQKYLNEMKYEQAILIFDEVIEIDPKCLDAYMGKANAYMALEDVENAVSTMQTAVKTAKDEYDTTGRKLQKINEVYALYAYILSNDGQFENAINILNQAKEWLNDDTLAKMLEELVGKTIAMDIPDAPIKFTDPVLEKDIRKIINKPNGDVMISDVWYVEEVKIYGDFTGDETDIKSYSRDYFNSSDGQKHTTSENIKTLNDLYYFRNLKKLTVAHHKGIDISVLGNEGLYPNLRMIDFRSCALKDVSAISGLTFLTGINLTYNDVADFTPISKLVRLSSLDVGHNDGIHSTEKLVNIKYLKSLNLFGINDVDMDAVTSLPNLRNLHISSGDYSKLSQCANLEYLEIQVNADNVKYLSELTPKCKRLRIHGTIGDLSAISGLTWLESLDLVAGISDGAPCDITFLENFRELKKLELGSSRYSGYECLSSLPNLQTVEVNKNRTQIIEELKKVLPEEKIKIKD